MRIRPSDLVRAFIRSFGVQGSWSRVGYLSGGLAYCLLPLLRRIYAGDPEGLKAALVRHLEPFNAHPYLVPMAVGALARLEADGTEPDTIRRVRRAMVGPLGAAGDRLVWTGWRPVCLLFAVVVYTLGADPWTAVVLFLLLYNAGHLLLRVWAFRRGWSEGPRAVTRLSGAAWRRLSTGLTRLAGLLAGTAAVLLGVELAPGGGAPLAAAAGLAGTVLGLRWPGAAGRAAAPAVGAALLVALLA